MEKKSWDSQLHAWFLEFFQLQVTNSNVMNSITKWANSTAKVTNLIANGTNSVTKVVIASAEAL